MTTKKQDVYQRTIDSLERNGRPKRSKFKPTPREPAKRVVIPLHVSSSLNNRLNKAAQTYNLSRAELMRQMMIYALNNIEQ